jgi:hypothetical protein
MKNYEKREISTAVAPRKNKTNEDTAMKKKNMEINFTAEQQQGICN